MQVVSSTSIGLRPVTLQLASNGMPRSLITHKDAKTAVQRPLVAFRGQQRTMLAPKLHLLTSMLPASCDLAHLQNCQLGEQFSARRQAGPSCPLQLCHMCCLHPEETTGHQYIAGQPPEVQSATCMRSSIQVQRTSS